MGAQRVSAPRIGLFFPGPPRAPGTWSGSPAGIARGLDAFGAAVVAVRAEPPWVVDEVVKNALALLRLRRAERGSLGEAVRFGRAVARVTPELAALRTGAVRVRLLSVGPLDGRVQIGTGYTLPRGAPTVTFEDITILQALELGYPEWLALSRRAVRARLERQKRAYAAATACCLPTRWAARSVVEDYGVPPEKVHVVGVGRNYEPLPRARDWSTPRFLFVGKGWKGKNGPAVLAAFEQLRREIPTARLDVVGDHPPLETEGVTGHGFVQLGTEEGRQRLGALFGSATCFVLPSRYEAAGIVYVEAAAAGIPSIGTTAGGAADLIGPAGRVVDPDDPDALLAAMLELSDPETASRLGRAAQERAELFTWPAVGERIVRALRLPGTPLDGLAGFV